MYLTNQLATLLSDKNEKQLRTSAYVIAGLVKSLGMTYTREIDLLNTINEECLKSKKTEPIRKQAGLYFFDAMSFIMGHSFEVYLP